MSELCPTCGAALKYHDDPDQETWSHVPGRYTCPNGHVFDEATIEEPDDPDDEYWEEDQDDE